MTDIIKLVNESEVELKDEFKKVDDICFYYSEKVLKAFKKKVVCKKQNS